MWIFTVNGFFTFVVDRKDPDMVWLRSRLREDLERNFPGVTVEEHPGADYLFRAKITRAELADHMVRLIADADVTSHFKDEMIKRAAKPVHGNRSAMMYALWNAGAAMQPYAPYSKVPRPTPQPVTWKGTSADRKPGVGQTSLSPYTYGGTGTGRYASEFDWDRADWNGGKAAKDPVVNRKTGEIAPEATDAEMDAWWISLTDDERDAILDEEEAEQRHREMADDFEAAARANGLTVPEVEFVTPAPRNRPGNRRKKGGKKGRRHNRHNQEGPAVSSERYAQECRDGKRGQEARNRQAYLDKKGARA